MKKSLTPLGETEMEVLHHVWALKRATVPEVHERILASRKVAYTTVMTVMRNLARKGYLHVNKEHATFVYRPAQTADQVRHSLLQELIEKVFKGSPAALVQTLVTYESLTDDERRGIKQLIDDLEDDDDPDR